MTSVKYEVLRQVMDSVWAQVIAPADCLVVARLRQQAQPKVQLRVRAQVSGAVWEQLEEDAHEAG